MKASDKNKPLAAIVCGYEHGGTTLASEILRQHPQLDSGFECGFLLAKKISDFPRFEPYYSMLKATWGIEDDQLGYICEANTWLDSYKRLIEKAKVIENKNTWIFDKTPRYMEFLPGILSKVPNVPCVVIVKDPRAVLWSWAKRSKLPKNDWVNCRIEDSCKRYLSYARGWQRAVQSDLSYEILTVQYESLCANPKAKVKEIMEFIGLDFQESLLSFSNGPRYSNVYGKNISNKYSKEYELNFSEEVCTKILDLTKEFKNWWWE